MPFIPHTDDDVTDMLEAIGVESVEQLFAEIPATLRIKDLPQIPPGMGEMSLSRLMRQRALQDLRESCYIGAGAYEHHIPAAVWEVASRGEFMTAYTPYQAEASQGTLQLIYEFQTMIASLMGLDVANASVYDGASGLAEAILMAVRLNRKSKSKRILVAGSLHPTYRKVIATLIKQEIELIDLPFAQSNGCLGEDVLAPYANEDIAAIIIQQPNFFGVLEDVDYLTDWAHAQNALVIASVNPVATALLKEPGQWGKQGADIACGDGQPLGVPLASGGPYYGFLACKKEYIRQMPGRIVGRTVDLEGKEGFTLTLQAREQHIRRSKATSNICTNQGWAVTGSTIYMSIMGAEGIAEVARQSHYNTAYLAEQLTRIEGVERVFAQPFFHEVVLRLPVPVAPVLDALAHRKIQGGFDLSHDFPELGHCLLICATETKTTQDLDDYYHALQAVLLPEKNKSCATS